jgi:FtsP/CotA-like multicopper oxidase with cupredoxin domain
MINRRQFLKVTGAGASALVTGGITSLVETAGAGATTKSAGKFNPDLDIALKATSAESSILYHCHNLEHEDMGMMRNYLIEIHN